MNLYGFFLPFGHCLLRVLTLTLYPTNNPDVAKILVTLHELHTLL